MKAQGQFHPVWVHSSGRSFYLTTFDAHVRHAQSRSPTEAHARVARAIARVGHADLDVLEMGSLGYTPPEGDERCVPGNVGGIEDNVLEADGKG